MKVLFYKTASGRIPVWDYVKELPKQDKARVLAVLDDVQKMGFNAVGVQFRQIDGKLWEMKISYNRIFYVVVRTGEMFLVHAYKKQGQKLPVKEREVALKRMKELNL